MNFSLLDFIVFGLYCLIVLGLGLFVARKKDTGDSEGYFLAGKSLPRLAIGNATTIFGSKNFI
jgi:SSS family solute:Na+ symporter